MALPRHRLIRLDHCQTYHCYSRCVRQAFLCGKDKKTGCSYGHRKNWIENLLIKCNELFCIDLIGYAIMSNHYHTVVRANKAENSSLARSEVIDRWTSLYKSRPVHMRNYLAGSSLTFSEAKKVIRTIRKWREDLISISRMMAYVNERVARWANKEDGCKGKFWESRFQSQALLDSTAILQAMIYVDLNPLRAGLSSLPEESDFTSIKRRSYQPDNSLFPFKSEIGGSIKGRSCLPFKYSEYLELLDWTGRQISDEKKGAIPDEAPAILQRMQLNPKICIQHAQPNLYWRNRVIGKSENVADFAASIGQNWCWQRSELLAK